MVAVTWRDEFACGVAIMDDDHKIIVKQVQQLADAVQRKQGASAVDGVLAVLQDYAAFHFERERALMEWTRFPGADAHAAEHDDLLRRVFQVCAAWRGGTVSDKDVLAFLADWLFKHILGSDRILGQHVVRCGCGRMVPPLPARQVIDWSSLSVLLVDDTLDFRRLLRGALNNLGIRRVHEARNGVEALQMMRRQDFDAVLTDDVMPLMGGLDLVREVRRSRPRPDPRTYMILLAAEGQDRQFLKEATMAGVHDVLFKPVTANSIKSRLQRHLMHPKPFQEVDGGLAPVRRSA